MENMVSEIIKMQQFNHPHVMPLIGVCLDTGPGVSIVMPFMTNGSLLDYLKKERRSLEPMGEEPNKVRSLKLILPLQVLKVILYSLQLYISMLFGLYRKYP